MAQPAVSLSFCSYCCRNLGCLCTLMPNRNEETEQEETGRVALIAGQRREHGRLGPQGLCPHPLEGVVRSLAVFKEQGVISSWTFSCLVGGEVIGSQRHQPSGSNQSGSTCSGAASSGLLPPGGGFSTWQTARRTWLRILSIVFEELPKSP